MNDAWSNINAKQRIPMIRRSSSSADEYRSANNDDLVPTHARCNPLPSNVVPPTMSSSSPISIPAPPPQSGSGTAAYSQDNYSSGEDHRAAMGGGGGLGPSGLSAALGELTVGSLPSHLLRSHGRVGGGGATSIRMQQRAGVVHRYQLGPDSAASGASAGNQFIGSASLPPPRAPFLSSKGWGPEGGLSAMPEVTLPESAVASSTDGSVHYGSLRESRFLGGMSPSPYPRPRGPGAAWAHPSLGPPVGVAGRDSGLGVDRHGCAPSEIARAPPSSITALDILTRTKESQTMTKYNAAAENVDFCNDTPSNGSESSRLNDGSRLPFDDDLSPTQNNTKEGSSSFDHYNQQHGSPDTFEAFDFELE
jgi:hypothetical protein